MYNEGEKNKNITMYFNKKNLADLMSMDALHALASTRTTEELCHTVICTPYCHIIFNIDIYSIIFNYIQRCLLLTAESFKYIRQCQNLQDLNLSECQGLTVQQSPSFYTHIHVLSLSSSTLLANADFIHLSFII